MPGFFEAIKNTGPGKQKVHTVTIQGQSIVVTLEKKLEVIKNGEDAYVWKSPTEFILKPKVKTKVKFPVLASAEQGLFFEDNDPYWVKGTGEKGHVWQIESE